MKLFLTVLTFLVLARVGAGEQCTSFAKSCYDDPYVAKIVCPDGQDCDCKDYGVDETSANCNTTGLTKEVTSGQCRSLCGEYNDPAQCKYFRWEKDSFGTNCTFMSADQCKDYKQCEGETHCKSDQVPECEDVPLPTTDKCPGGSVFSTDHGVVHWTCYDPYHPNDYVSIYDQKPPATVPAGTLCWTVHRCTNFDAEKDDKSGDIAYRNLVAQCSIVDDDTSGTWVQYPAETGNVITAAITEEDGKLIDQTCLPAENLTLDASKLVEVGVSFICSELDPDHYDTDTTPGKIVLKQYNHCVLLCNFHLVMTIEPKLDGEGGDEPKWWKYLANGQDSEVVPADVKCWD